MAQSPPQEVVPSTENSLEAYLEVSPNGCSRFRMPSGLVSLNGKVVDLEALVNIPSEQSIPQPARAYSYHLAVPSEFSSPDGKSPYLHSLCRLATKYKVLKAEGLGAKETMRRQTRSQLLRTGTGPLTHQTNEPVKCLMSTGPGGEPMKIYEEVHNETVSFLATAHRGRRARP